MAVTFQEFCDGELVEVEITRGGDLVLHGYDSLEEDAVLNEMGYEASRCLYLVQQWEREPITVIVKMLYLDLDLSLLLAVDWVRHAIGHLDEQEVSDLRRAETFALLESIENVAHDHIDRLEASDIWKRHVAIREGRFDFYPSIDVVEVAKAAGYAMKASSTVAAIKTDTLTYQYQQAMEFIRNSLGGCALRSRNSVGFNNISGQKREALWQIKRFVDVMEAKQEGEPYPPLEETE
jgi:hypothetical protein